MVNQEVSVGRAEERQVKGLLWIDAVASGCSERRVGVPGRQSDDEDMREYTRKGREVYMDRTGGKRLVRAEGSAMLCTE